MKNPSYLEIAKSWDLWTQHVDPTGIGTEEEFNSMSVRKRIFFIETCFDPEEEEKTSSNS